MFGHFSGNFGRPRAKSRLRSNLLTAVGHLFDSSGARWVRRGELSGRLGEQLLRSFRVTRCSLPQPVSKRPPTSLFALSLRISMQQVRERANSLCGKRERAKTSESGRSLRGSGHVQRRAASACPWHRHGDVRCRRHHAHDLRWCICDATAAPPAPALPNTRDQCHACRTLARQGPRTSITRTLIHFATSCTKR